MVYINKTGESIVWIEFSEGGMEGLNLHPPFSVDIEVVRKLSGITYPIVGEVIEVLNDVRAFKVKITDVDDAPYGSYNYYIFKGGVQVAMDGLLNIVESIDDIPEYNNHDITTPVYNKYN